jgi:hypothetical protein
MKKMSMLTGFGVGYYLGARAGRERYEEINDLFRKVRGSQPVQRASDAAESLVEHGTERMAEKAERVSGDGRTPRSRTATYPSLATTPSAAAVGE